MIQVTEKMAMSSSLVLPIIMAIQNIKRLPLIGGAGRLLSNIEKAKKKRVCGANTHRGNSRLYTLEKIDAFINPDSPNLGLQTQPQLPRENLKPFGIRNFCWRVTLVDEGIQE